MSKYDWEGALALGRAQPGVPFLPIQLVGAPRRLVGVIRQRRVRILRQGDGHLEPSVVNFNPDTGLCDIWLRWVPSSTVEIAPTVGRNGVTTE